MATVLPIENQEIWESDHGSDTSWQSALSSSSLALDQCLLGYSPNTLRPIGEVRRSDPRVILFNCDIPTNTVSQNSEHVTNQQPFDLTAQLRDALTSPEIAEVMQSYVTTGLQNFIAHHHVPLQNKVEENERTTNEKKIQEIHKAMERNKQKKIHQQEEKCANSS